MRRTLLAAVLIVAGCLFVIARLAAQEVVVSPPSWIDDDDPPEQLPQFKAFHPEFPPELKKTADIGWAVIDLFVDDHGRLLTVSFQGTQPAYQKAAEDAEGASDRKFKPAEREGKPANSRTRVSVAFNPASASAAGPDATPRLLRAVPAVQPAWKRIKDDPAHRPETVWARVTVDENGQVTAVNDTPGEFLGILTKVVGKWRFTPARHAGRPIAAEVRVPFIVTAPDSPEQSGKNVIPVRVTYRENPEYPRLLSANRVQGEVTVVFVIDIEGRVRKEHVVASSYPVFDEPALAAIRKWKFLPTMVDGVPVVSEVQQDFAFNIPGGGSDGFEVKKHADLSKLPEAMRYDTEPKITAVVLPKYPFDLLKKQVKGSAQVDAVVDTTGEVVATKIANASKPEFGLALQAAVERFHYMPALKDGQPIRSLTGFEQKFYPWSSEKLVTSEDEDALRLEEKHPERIAKAADLDRKLKVIHAEPPQYPTSLAERPAGNAKVEFLVDETGHVRVPRILSATKEEFGYAAVQAVSAWTFDPPTSKGKGVTVRVVVPIDFHVSPPVQSGEKQSKETR